MKNSMMRFVVATCLLGLCTAVPAASPEDVPPVVEPARVIKLNPSWPGYNDREALVFLDFDLPPSGKPTNIRLAEGGFHEKRFVNAAIRGLERSTWQPRRVNGEPVTAIGLRQPFRFSIEGIQPGVTNEFKAEAAKVSEFLGRGDFAGGHFHAQWMLAEKVKLNFEYAVLEAQLAETFALAGRTPEALRYAWRATARNVPRPEFMQLLEAIPQNDPANYLLPEELVVRLLELRMRLTASQGLLLESMTTWYELAGLGEYAQDHPLPVLAAAMKAHIQGPTDLRAKVDTGEEGYWKQFLSRRSFTLVDVQGSVHVLRVHCSAQSRIIPYVSGVDWSIPASWGLCTAEVNAEPGTTFQFVEFAPQPP